MQPHVAPCTLIPRKEIAPFISVISAGDKVQTERWKAGHCIVPVASVGIAGYPLVPSCPERGNAIFAARRQAAGSWPKRAYNFACGKGKVAIARCTNRCKRKIERVIASTPAPSPPFPPFPSLRDGFFVGGGCGGGLRGGGGHLRCTRASVSNSQFCFILVGNAICCSHS